MRRLLAVAVLVAAGFVVAVPARAGGGCHGGGPLSGAGTTVELRLFCMQPRVLHAPEGAEITFVNRDEVNHNLYGDRWGVDSLQAGESYRHRFTVGTHLFACTLHPGMLGAVVVGEAAESLPVVPVRATTDDGGGSSRWILAGLVGIVVGAGATEALRRGRRARGALG